MGSLAFFNLQDFITRYETKVFIELGTHLGDGVREALRYPFDRVISVEIEPSLAYRAMKLFEVEPRVEIKCGHSVKVLREILPTVSSNLLCWQDGHFPGSDCGIRAYDAEENDEVRLPLEAELHLFRELRASKGFKDVYLLDDLWLWVGNEAALKRPEILPRQSFQPEFWKYVLADTHNCSVIPEHEIYAVLTPKD